MSEAETEITKHFKDVDTSFVVLERAIPIDNHEICKMGAENL